MINEIVNKNAIPPIVGVPLLCLCSLTIGLSAIFACNNILLTYHVKNIDANNVIKKRINKSILFILPHKNIFKSIKYLLIIVFNIISYNEVNLETKFSSSFFELALTVNLS